MIEIIEKQVDGFIRYDLMIDGEKIRRCSLHESPRSNDQHLLRFSGDAASFKRLISQRPKEVARYFAELYVLGNYYDGDGQSQSVLDYDVNFHIASEHTDNPDNVRIGHSWHVANLELKYGEDEDSDIEYGIAFRRIANKENGFLCGFDTTLCILDISTIVDISTDEPLAKAYDQLEKFIGEVHLKAESAITRIAETNDEEREASVTVRFDFPESVRTPCSQYLFYFGQFLADMGVGASTTLNRDASDVLFTITPDNPDIALEKIYQALSYYLGLPANPAAGGTAPTDEGFIALRARMEAQHFRDQIANYSLAVQTQQATIQAQQATIQAQQATLGVLQTTVQEQQIVIGQIRTPPMLAQAAYPDVLRQSVRGVEFSSKDGKKEEILGGLVKFGDAENKTFGVSIGVGEAVRMFKAWFADLKEQKAIAQAEEEAADIDLRY